MMFSKLLQESIRISEFKSTIEEIKKLKQNFTKRFKETEEKVLKLKYLQKFPNRRKTEKEKRPKRAMSQYQVHMMKRDQQD